MTCLTNPISQTGLEILPTCNWKGQYEVTGYLLTSIFLRRRHQQQASKYCVSFNIMLNLWLQVGFLMAGLTCDIFLFVRFRPSWVFPKFLVSYTFSALVDRIQLQMSVMDMFIDSEQPYPLDQTPYVSCHHCTRGCKWVSRVFFFDIR